MFDCFCLNTKESNVNEFQQERHIRHSKYENSSRLEYRRKSIYDGFI